MRLTDGTFGHLSPNLRHDMFDQPSPQADWLAGLLAADGCVKGNGRLWCLTQSGDHGRALVEQVRNMVGQATPICSYQPASGATSHSIEVTSPPMVAALTANYYITPRKTLTLRWPPLSGDRAAAFLRGYIDGDGCVGVYRVAQADAMLSVSFVGTSAFIEGAATEVPNPFRRFVLRRCVDLVDARWSGRYAWAAGQWIYQHATALPASAKSARFVEYGQLLSSDPPAWRLRAARRQKVVGLLDQGIQPMRVAELTGEKFQTVYKWRSSMDKGA